MKKETKDEIEKSKLDKREKEKEIVGLMIKIYCKGHNHEKMVYVKSVKSY